MTPTNTWSCGLHLHMNITYMCLDSSRVTFSRTEIIQPKLKSSQTQIVYYKQTTPRSCRHEGTRSLEIPFISRICNYKQLCSVKTLTKIT